MASKVLLAEDDNNLREIYQARLVAEGYEVVTAQNGEEALAAAKQHMPDLIISDVMMPRISGFEMLDILRNTDGLKDTKVIMLTALGQADDRGRADNLGADKYLVKSQVTLEDIVTSAKQMLGDSAEGQVAITTDESDTQPTEQAEQAQPSPTTFDNPTAVSPTPQVADSTVVDRTDPVVDPVSPLPVDTTATDSSSSSDSSDNPISPVADSPVVTSDDVTLDQAQAQTQVQPVTDDSSFTQAVEEPQSTPSFEQPSETAETPNVESAEASVTSSEPQSLQAEEAALQAQINSLVGESEASAESPAIEIPQEDAPQNSPQEEPVFEAPAESALPAAEPEQPTSDVAEAPVLPETPAETAGQIISPETSQPAPDNHAEMVIEPPRPAEEKPSLEDLVAKELAMEEAQAQQPQDSQPGQVAPESTTPNEQAPQSRVTNPDINNMAL